jgi:hypothetical protein
VLYSKTDLSLSGNLYVNSINIGRGGGSVATNTAIGTDALVSNTNGSNNTALGYKSLNANTTGGYNVSIGVNSLVANTIGNFNLAIGNESLISNTAGGLNVALGHGACALITGTSNVAVGVGSLRGNSSFSCNYNIGVGENCLRNITSGSNNTAVGYQAGYAGVAITTGSNNTFLGYNTQANANNYSNSTAIGAGAIITGNNQVVLGRTTETVVIPNQIQVSYNSLPTFTSNSIGYTASFSLATLAAGTGSRNTTNTSIALPVGVYMCHLWYQINITHSSTTRNLVELHVASGASLVNRAMMGFVYATAHQEYNYYSIPAILNVSANPCSVYSSLIVNGGNCSINNAVLGVVRIA